MPSRLFRTGDTSLTEDDLLILDVMFDSLVTPSMLQRSSFVPRFMAMPHALDDVALKATISRLTNDGIVTPTEHELHGERYIAMTPSGGQVWSSERLPIWDRYCTERYPSTVRDRTIMSVSAVSANTRDDFLRLWPEYPARRKCVTIRDTGLIYWHPFSTLYVGLASYHEPREWTCDEHTVWLKRHKEYLQRIESERSWWRTVHELQKFLE